MTRAVALGVRFTATRQGDRIIAGQGRRRAALQPRAPRSDAEHKALVSELRDLLAQRAIEEVPSGEERFKIAYSSPIFTIPKKVAPGDPPGYRLIYNCKRSGLNRCLYRLRFRLPSLDDVRNHVLAHAFAATADVKGAFLHSRLDEASMRLCGFAAKFGGKTRTFRWRVLPFGVSQSPCLHSTRLQVCIDHALKRLRGDGVRANVIPYVDDILTSGATFEEANRAHGDVLAQLARFGWTIHTRPDKTDAEPKRVVEFLGLCWDFEHKTVCLSKPRVRRLVHELRRTARACARDTLRLVQLQRCVGLVVSARYGLQQAHLYLSRPLRLLRRLVRARTETVPRRRPRKRRAFPSRAAEAKAVTDAGEALLHTADNIRQWNGRSLRPPRLLAEVATDASDSGAGAVLYKPGSARLVADGDGALHLEGDAVDKLAWPVPADLSAATIAVKEAYASVTALRLWLYHHRWRDGRVHLYSDNTVSVAYVKNPLRRVQELEDLLLPLHIELAERNVTLTVSYVRSAQNTAADALSRMPSALAAAESHPDALRAIERAWGLGPLLVDMFATPSDAKAATYASPIDGAGAVGRDGTQLSLGSLLAATQVEGETPWALAFPPPSKLSRVLPALAGQLARAQTRSAAMAAVIIAPWWPSRPWMPLLLHRAREIILLPSWAVETPDPHYGRARSGRQRRPIRWVAVRWDAAVAPNRGRDPTAGGQRDVRGPRVRVARLVETAATDLPTEVGSGPDADLIRSIRCLAR